MKKYLVLGLVIFMLCLKFNFGATGEKKEAVIKGKEFRYELDPDSFDITFSIDGKKEQVSSGFEKKKVVKTSEKDNKKTITYEEGVVVDLTKEKDYLQVEIEKRDGGKFTWPKVEGESYYLPIGEGKLIPKDDANWLKFLGGEEYDTLESFSMQIFAVNKGKYTIVYIIENPYNNKVKFEKKNGLNFSFTHEFIEFNKEKKYGFRIYVTENNPVNIAKIYKNYLIEKGNFKTLEEKSKKTKDIEKLYGAPHIYLWGQEFIAKDNIKWSKFINLNSSMIELKNSILLYSPEGKEAVKNIEKLKEQGFVDEYQKNIITKALNEVLMKREFSNSKEKNLKDLYSDNKKYLKEILGDSIDPIEKWGNGNSIELLKDMKSKGIDRAWLGFDGWETGYMNPNFVDYAKDEGYLIGTYDSYHSIHKKGEEKWSTAAFEDKSLYENATVTNKFGEKLKGFNGVGRKLNPLYSFSAVNKRVDGILNDGIHYNSWFIDCDAAGEIYDDYSKKTTKQQDLEARMKRMEIIEDKGLVIGSELGLDYASKTIAFAHGLETPVIAWGDEDMKNPNSKYFVGKYYAPKGGAPEIFVKEIPIKDQYREIYFSPKCNVPLYKLVYNNSVITTHHWLYGSLKFNEELKSRRVYEMLYNVPPLYHLDKEMWKKYGDEITKFHKTWSPFHKKAVQEEMTDFQVLTEDRLVQRTKFGNSLEVIGNFSGKDFDYKGKIVKSQSYRIID